MLARDLMTKEVVTVTPETPVEDIARALIEHGISAVPVVDAAGVPIGMVSEGDLIGRTDSDRRARRDWWLVLLAEGEELHPDYLASLRRPQRTAREVMASPVIQVTETTGAAEIARVLSEYRIKRVPVVRDGKIIGIVSRADLLGAVAGGEEVSAPAAGGPQAHGLIADAVSAIERGFGRRERKVGQTAAHADEDEDELSIDSFRHLVTAFGQEQAERRNEASRDAALRRRQRVKELIDQHFSDESWRTLLHHAREAAEHGDKECILLRFPSDLCSDGGRAINAPLEGWPQTLRGEAAEIYLRWEHELKPRGFHLAARVLDFPGGKPGDLGLFLVWGE